MAAVPSAQELLRSCDRSARGRGVTLAATGRWSEIRAYDKADEDVYR